MPQSNNRCAWRSSSAWRDARKDAGRRLLAGFGPGGDGVHSLNKRLESRKTRAAAHRVFVYPLGMPSTLLELWQRDDAILVGKSFAQVVRFSGDGQLRDGGKTSAELRELLAAVPLATLTAFADECLRSGFSDSGFALQDIVNQIGLRLGFEVRYGRYRGTRNDVGFDGLWTAKDGHTLILEVKTTDAYRINLDTIADYRQDLMRAGEVKAESSILVAVGRQDTGDLEAQIRGSRHAWDIRLISIDALLRLAAVKEEMNDWTTISQINTLLRPMEYTRLDAIVELLFAASKDEEEGSEADGGQEKSDADTKAATARAREMAIKKASTKLGRPLVRKGKALHSTSDGTTNIVCLVSRRYDGPAGSGNYWYGFTAAHRDFLDEATFAYVVLACSDSGMTLMIDWVTFAEWLPEMLTTPPAPAPAEEARHWHVYFNDYGDRIELVPAAGSAKRDLIRYVL